MTRKHRRRFRWRSVYIWHRWIGVVTALLVLVAATTGLALNHTEALGLSQRHVASDWLLDWYGISTNIPVTSYQAGEHYISVIGDRLYLDAHPVVGTTGSLIGAVMTAGMVVAGTETELLLLTPAGELIERVGSGDPLPQRMEQIGNDTNNQLVISGSGTIRVVDRDLLNWTQAEPGDYRWSKPVQLPSAMHSNLMTGYRGSGLPLERVLLDLHSGRILGTGGTLLMDGAAIGFCILALSGMVLWLRGILAGRRRKRH